MSLRIGLDLGGTKIEGIALEGSRECARLRVATPRDDYPGTLHALVSMVADLEAGTGVQATVGVGIPGTISPSTSRVKNANSVWLIGQPLQADLEARLGREIRVANDANCFAVSEAADGAGAGASVVFGVIVGTGTGAGIVVHGRVLTGPNGIAGEWGHNPLPWPDDEERPGPECYCGKRGCVETFLSGPAMSADHERRTGRHLSPPEIAAAAARGDARALATRDRYERRMARALAGVINMVDPDVIVLGGGMSAIEGLCERVPRLWGDFVFRATGAGPHAGGAADAEQIRTRLVRAVHGASSGVRGAAWLWGVE